MTALNVKPTYQQEEVFQLLYISAAVHDFTEEELNELLLKARQNNESMGVSGMLLFHEGSFIQALEGEEQSVKALYEKIAQDKRHTETLVMFTGMVAERDFDGWSMGFYRSNQSSAKNLEEFRNFMSDGFRSPHQDGGSSARQAMRTFRESMWRDSLND